MEVHFWNDQGFDRVSSILANVDWADAEDLLRLDGIKGFAVFISQARCSSSSVGADSRRDASILKSKRGTDPASSERSECLLEYSQLFTEPAAEFWQDTVIGAVEEDHLRGF